MASEGIAAGEGRHVYCLVMDLIGSVKIGVQLSSVQLDDFNLEFVRQIQPHLSGVRLHEAALKFTGDGWVLHSANVDDVLGLCALALIMARRFQSEMSRATGLSEDRIPALRAAVCAGRDLAVDLPDGRRDWLGDSARRASRLVCYCLPNEVLIDETVRQLIFRDVGSVRAALRSRHDLDCKDIGEPLVAHSLRDVRAEAAAESGARDALVYMVGMFGKVDVAASAVLSRAAASDGADRARSLQPSWRRLLNAPITYEEAAKLLARLILLRLPMDVSLFNLVLAKAPTEEAVRELLHGIDTARLRPDAVTYLALIRKSRNFAVAQRWFDELVAAGFTPDVSVYEALVEKADSYAGAVDLFAQMRGVHLQPTSKAYRELIARAPDFKTALRHVDEMRASAEVLPGFAAQAEPRNPQIDASHSPPSRLPSEFRLERSCGERRNRPLSIDLSVVGLANRPAVASDGSSGRGGLAGSLRGLPDG